MNFRVGDRVFLQPGISDGELSKVHLSFLHFEDMSSIGTMADEVDHREDLIYVDFLKTCYFGQPRSIRIYLKKYWLGIIPKWLYMENLNV